VEFRPRFGNQGIARENRQGFLYVGEMPRAIFGNVSFSVAVVVADAS